MVLLPLIAAASIAQQESVVLFAGMKKYGSWWVCVF
jgi:hypothetical protein